MDIKHGDGKLYRFSNQQMVSAVEYKLYEEQDPGMYGHWWGELYLDSNLRIIEDKNYVMEFQDGRKGRCVVKRLSNRVLIGIPSRHMYRFTGMGTMGNEFPKE
jgi:hypothetical protein